MTHVHLAPVGAAALLLALGLCVSAGCSCEESEAPQPRVVKAGRPEPRAARPADSAPSQPARRERQVGESLLHTPGDYVSTVAVTVPRYARRSINHSVLTQEIEQYRAMHGRYPASLAVLAEWSGRPTPAPPSGYEHAYDPQTGKLELVPTDQ